MCTPLTSLGTVVPSAAVNPYVLCTVLLPGFVKNQPQEGGGVVAPQLQARLQGREQLTSADRSKLALSTHFAVVCVLRRTPSFSLCCCPSNTGGYI